MPSMIISVPVSAIIVTISLSVVACARRMTLSVMVRAIPAATVLCSPDSSPGSSMVASPDSSPGSSTGSSTVASPGSSSAGFSSSITGSSPVRSFVSEVVSSSLRRSSLEAVPVSARLFSVSFSVFIVPFPMAQMSGDVTALLPVTFTVPSSVRDAVSVLTKMPPPLFCAELPVISLSLTMAAPPVMHIPPPVPAALSFSTA